MSDTTSALDRTDVVTSIYRVVDSPVGLLTLAGDGDVLTRLYMDGQRHAPDHHGWKESRGAFAPAVAELEAYFAQELRVFSVPIALHGTEFQRRVWKGLREIPYGETWSYGELARAIGQPGAARAVGLANGRNPVAIIVPCHRVIGSSGTLTGYGGGLDRKRALLDLERGIQFLT